MQILNKTNNAKTIRKTFTLTIITLILAVMKIPAAMAAEITTAKLYYPHVSPQRPCVQ